MSSLRDFDSYIQESMESWHCPGVAVAVIKGDEVLHQGAYGVRDVEEGLPVTEDTRFALASVTKSFTAMSVALLVDEGKLEWDKPVREYMPEFILDDAYATQHVTIRDMLSHRTGMPRHDLSARRLEITRAEFIKRMKYLKFSATLREKFQYNNLMYDASAYLVERLAEQRWEDFVQDRIFSPLDMNSSNLEPILEGQINAEGYRVDRNEAGRAKGLINMPFGRYTELSPGAAGALFSTLADMTEWLKLHINEGVVRDIQIISRENIHQMHLPQMMVPGGGLIESLFDNTIFTYGMGWFVKPYRDYTLIYHGGNVEGHSVIIGFVPQKKTGVVILTNIAGLPLRDVLMYEGVDRALDLPERDWNARFHKIYDPLIAGQAKSKQTSAEERKEDAPSTHSLETYTGTYEAKGYPDFTVKLKGEGLEACTVGSLEWSELRHYHHNVFEWDIGAYDISIKIRFLKNDYGEIDSVSIPIEAAIDNLTFFRKPPELSEDIVAELVGEYALSQDGIVYTVTAHEGKVHVALTGNAPQEIKPHKLENGMIGFKMNRNRLEFVRENGKITHLVMKMPQMTLEAPRKKQASR